jgi:RNA polymerase sigma-70 factor (ECF subfamily)
MENDFVKILNDHRALLYKVCNVYCRDPEDRKDLFQEIVLQVWKSLKTFRNESAIGTWMYRIALNTAITHFRKEKQRSELKISMEEIQHSAEGTDEEQKINELFNAIETLDKIDKSIILLYLEEKSYDEISDITGLTKSNVGVRLNRIKTKLSDKLNPSLWTSNC